MNYEVRRIERKDCEPFILGIHYAKRWPSISFAYGLFLDSILVGVVSYGSPASPWLCKGVCGEEFRKQVIELNRLVLSDNRKNEASLLVGRSLKMLGAERDSIVVSYADTAHNHTGFIYQATNFLFTGTTKPRTDMASVNGKHSRHNSGDRNNRVFRSAKHRYVTFIGNRRFRRLAKSALRYGVLPYPK
jgi:hypothetical protein